MLFVLGPFAMQLSGGFAACCISFFGRFESAKVVALPVKFDSGDIETSTFNKGHAFVTACVVSLRTTVSVVLRRCRFAQVFPAVVRFYFILVVDFFRRPAAFHPHPNNAMGEVVLASDPNFNASLVIASARYSSDRSALRQGHFPAQFASFRCVIEYLANKCWREVIMSVLMFSRHVGNVSHLEVAFKL